MTTTLDNFLNAVRLMRQHQKAYFRDRKHSDLITAKNYEQIVDRALGEGVVVPVEILTPVPAQPEAEQPTLFEENNDETEAQ